MTDFSTHGDQERGRPRWKEKRQMEKYPPFSGCLGSRSRHPSPAPSAENYTSLEAHFILKTGGQDPPHVSNDRTPGGPQLTRRQPHQHTSHRTPQLELSALGLPIPILFCPDWLVPSTSPMDKAWQVTWFPVTCISYCKTCLGFQHLCGEGPLKNP